MLSATPTRSYFGIERGLEQKKVLQCYVSDAVLEFHANCRQHLGSSDEMARSCLWLSEETLCLFLSIDKQAVMLVAFQKGAICLC